MNGILYFITALLGVGDPSIPGLPVSWIATWDNLAAPAGLAVLPDGHVLAVERHLHRVQRINANGTIQIWSGPDDRVDPWYRPSGIAASAEGRVAIADTGNHRIQILDDRGQVLQNVVRLGDEPLRAPADVDLSATAIAIADTGNHRVVLTNENGDVIWTLTEAEGQPLRYPGGVALADDGGVFIADTGNHRVLAVNAEGVIQAAWGDWGRFPGLFAEPSGIDTHDQFVFVTDRLNHRVQVFTREGKPVTWWDMHAMLLRQGEGHIHYPEDIAIHPHGDVAVVSEPFERRLQTFGPGEPSRPSRSATRAPRGMQSHFADVVAADGRGLFAWEPEVRSIAAFVTDLETPVHVTTFGSPGRRPGQVSRIADLCWDDEQQTLTVFDEDRLHRWRVTLPARDQLKYDPNAAVLLATLPLPEVLPGRKLQVNRAVQDAQGQFHVIDSSLDAVLTLTPEGRVARRWDIDFDPVALAVRDDRLAISDGRSGEIHIFSTDGTPLRVIDAPADLKNPWTGGVALLEDGTMVTSDRHSDRIDLFGADGAWLRTFSGPGTDVGLSWLPGEITQDAQGRIVVLDHGNHRLQAFEPEKGWVLTFGLGRSYTPNRLPRRRLP